MPRQMRLVGADERPPEDQWRAQLIYTRDGLKDCRENVVYMLRDHPEWSGVLGADTFGKRVVVRRKSPLGHEPNAEWTPDDDVQLGLWLAQQESLVVRSEETIARAVAFVAKLSPFHPVRDFLDSLEWDNESRIDTWVPRYLGSEESMYSSLVGRFFLINMVRRIYEPGCVMRSLPVLEGGENIGKSAVARVLARPWYSDTAFDLNNLKDVFLLFQGIWLYEVAELDSFARAESTRIKAVISSTKDRFRAPYDKAAQDQLRETCFIATTNKREYLRDWDGANTRFHPLLCEKLDLAGLEAARDQLFAEALAIYRAGGPEARAYPTREEEEKYFEPEREQRLSVHPWFYTICRWLAEDGEGEDGLTVNEVMNKALKIQVHEMGRNLMAEQVIGRTFTKLRWHKRRDPKADDAGVRHWRWFRPRAEPERVNPDDVPF